MRRPMYHNAYMPRRGLPVDMRRTVLILLLATSLAMAGCLAGDDGGSDVEAQDASANASDATGASSNTTENATEPTHAWNTTTREGTLRGGNAGVFVYSNPQGSDASQNWTVAPGSTQLIVNLTTGSDEVYFTITPPGCEGGSFGGSDCETTNTTAGGTIYMAEDPEPGTWEITMFRNEPGYGTTDYVLTADVLEPLEG